MILCPNCHHQELPGALFCSECGAQLVSSDSMTTQSFDRIHSDILNSDVLKNISVDVSPSDVVISKENESMVSLRMVNSGKLFHLSGRMEYSLGRIAEGQPILPDVDLSEFEAYSQGVSRLHASIKVGPQRISVMDLGSSNGTRVNGQKIVPHVDYPVKHGDIIALGKLKIQLIIHK